MSDPAPGPDRIPPAMRLGLVSLVLAAGLVGLALARSPAGLRFEGFAFGDWGANLTAQSLVTRGFRPAVDFVYPYGLLSLAAGRAWFTVAGSTPHAYFEAMLVAHAATAVGLARFLMARKAGWGGLALVAALLPYVVPAMHTNFAHAMESVLLVNAIAAHAEGRRGQALALATAAAFCKPSMAYIYGVILVGCIFATEGRPAWRRLIPASITGAVLLLALLAIHGPEALARTQLPTEAAGNYEANNFGFFFGSGRNYWLPAGAGPRHYLGTQRGWWLAATLVLSAGGAIGLARWVRLEGNGRSLANELPLVLASLHLVFIALFFGNEFSWVYYNYVLVMGIVSLGALGGWGRRLVWGFAALGLLCDRGVPGEARGMWAELSPSAATSNLYAAPGASTEWAVARGLWRGKRTVLLAWSGNAAVVDPSFEPDPKFFAMPGMDSSPDIERLAKAVREAEVLVIPTDRSQSFTDYLTRDCAVLAEALEGTRVIFDGDWVVVRERP